MRSVRIPAALAFVAMLAACQAKLDLAVDATQAPRAGASPKASATPGATATPKGGGTPVPGGTPAAKAAPPRLLAPAAGVSALTGAIKVDASYMVSAGAGNLANKGGAVVAAGAGKLIGMDGGSLIGLDGGSLVGMDGGSLVGNGGNTLIGMDGGSLVGQDGGSVIGMDGGSLIGMDGGSLIGMDGGSMVAAGAGNLKVSFDAAGNMVAAGAGNMVAAGAGNYALKQAAAPAVAPGTQLPAAGMLVSVVSLRDHTYLPLGENAKGEKVYSVYTRGDGSFKVFVPSELRDNVLVVASVPQGRDPRLAYNVVARAEDAKPIAVDDLAATTTRYVRLALTGRIAGVLENPILATDLLKLENQMTEEGRNDLIAMVTELTDAQAQARRTDDLNDEQRYAMAQRVLDAMLAAVPLETLVTTDQDALTWQGRNPEPTLPMMRASLDAMLKGARKRLDANPDAFTQAFFDAKINADGPGLPQTTPIEWSKAKTTKVVTPRDLTDIVLEQYLSIVRVGVAEPVRRLFRYINGMDDPYTCNKADLCPEFAEPILKASDAEVRMRAASLTLNRAFARKLKEDADLKRHIVKILLETPEGPKQ